MSTRCVIEFTEGDDVVACIYRHSDGYPDGPHGVPDSLERFFAAVEEQCGGDNRYDDPCYLAARFVVWQAAQWSRGGPLNFLSLGITPSADSHGDLAWVYRVDCDRGDARPKVTWRAA